jgi:hypothetical protein
MDIKQFISMEVVKGNSTFKAYLPISANWQEAKEAMIEMYDEVVKQAELARLQAANQAKSDTTPIEPEVVSEKKE